MLKFILIVLLGLSLFGVGKAYVLKVDEDYSKSTYMTLRNLTPELYDRTKDKMLLSSITISLIVVLLIILS